MGMIIASGTPAPDGQYLLQFLLVLSFLGNLVLIGLQIARRNQPQKREVSFMDQCAGKEAFDKHVHQNQAEHDKLHARISSGDQRLQEELKSVGRELSGVRASNDIQTQHLLRVEAKIDRAIERGHES